MKADFNHCFGLRDGKLGQTDGDLWIAFLRPDVRRHPLQGRGAASVKADPLSLVIINGYGDTHAAGTHFEGEGFGKGSKLIRFEDADRLRLKIDLDSAPAKKVCPQQSVNRAFARVAELGQIYRNIIAG